MIFDVYLGHGGFFSPGVKLIADLFFLLSRQFVSKRKPQKKKKSRGASLSFSTRPDENANRFGDVVRCTSAVALLHRAKRTFFSTGNVSLGGIGCVLCVKSSHPRYGLRSLGTLFGPPTLSARLSATREELQVKS